MLAYPSRAGTPTAAVPPDSSEVPIPVLADLIASGRIVDLMGVFVALEIALLLLWRARTGAGIAPLPLLTNIGAGGSLMLALRASLTGAGTGPIAGWLLAALACHAADLALRWRR